MKDETTEELAQREAELAPVRSEDFRQLEAGGHLAGADDYRFWSGRMSQPLDDRGNEAAPFNLDPSAMLRAARIVGFQNSDGDAQIDIDVRGGLMYVSSTQKNGGFHRGLLCKVGIAGKEGQRATACFRIRLSVLRGLARSTSPNISFRARYDAKGRVLHVKAGSAELAITAVPGSQHELPEPSGASISTKAEALKRALSFVWDDGMVGLMEDSLLAGSKSFSSVTRFQAKEQLVSRPMNLLPSHARLIASTLRSDRNQSDISIWEVEGRFHLKADSLRLYWAAAEQWPRPEEAGAGFKTALTWGVVIDAVKFRNAMWAFKAIWTKESDVTIEVLNGEKVFLSTEETSKYGLLNRGKLELPVLGTLEASDEALVSKKVSALPLASAIESIFALGPIEQLSLMFGSTEERAVWFGGTNVSGEVSIALKTVNPKAPDRLRAAQRRSRRSKALDNA